MKRTVSAACMLFGLTAGTVAWSAPDLGALVGSHQWFKAREAVLAGGAPPIISGLVACAFHESAECQTRLQSVIKAAPESGEARGAHSMLAVAHQIGGHYGQMLSELDEILKLQPGDMGAKNGRIFFSAFSQHGDQQVVRRRPGGVRYEIRNELMHIPVEINGKPARYIVDTAANLSTLTESEAARLGLKVTRVGGTGVDATGNAISLEAAVADRMTIAGVELRNVGFVVVDDGRVPFASAPQQEKGVLGLPVLVALGRIRWNRGGAFEALPEGPRAVRQPNLCFDGGDVITEVESDEGKLTLLLDTGVGTSRLWPSFARDYAGIVDPHRKGERTSVWGVAGSKEVEVARVPDLRLKIGGLPASIHPFDVLLQETTPLSHWHYGVLGMDLLRQARVVTIDFGTMTLALE